MRPWQNDLDEFISHYREFLIQEALEPDGGELNRLPKFCLQFPLSPRGEAPRCLISIKTMDWS